jgi:hypothetical protein
VPTLAHPEIPFTIPAFALTQAEVNCEKSGGIWDADKKVCEIPPDKQKPRY